MSEIQPNLPEDYNAAPLPAKEFDVSDSAYDEIYGDQHRVIYEVQGRRLELAKDNTLLIYNTVDEQYNCVLHTLPDGSVVRIKESDDRDLYHSLYHARFNIMLAYKPERAEYEDEIKQRLSKLEASMRRPSSEFTSVGSDETKYAVPGLHEDYQRFRAGAKDLSDQDLAANIDLYRELSETTLTDDDKVLVRNIIAHLAFELYFRLSRPKSESQPTTI